MIKWEYKTSNGPLSEINTLGKEGWEVINVTRTERGFEVYYLKRQYHNGDDTELIED